MSRIVTAVLLAVATLFYCLPITKAQAALPTDQSQRIIDAIGAEDQAGLFREVPRKEDLDAPLSSGDTAVIVAIALKKPTILSALLDHGADINATSARGWTPLMVAIYFANRQAIDLLLSKGAKADIHAEDGATARSIAEWKGDRELASKLPEIHAKRSFSGDDLVTAVSMGDHDTVTQALKAGVPPIASDKSGNPVLLIAAAAGDMQVLQELLSAGAPVDQVGPNGVTPLMVAVQQKQTVIVRLLLAAKADPLHQTTGTQGVSALSIAEALNLDDMADLLRGGRRKGWDSERDVSALAVAISTNNGDVTEHLLEKGVSPNGGTVGGKRLIPLSIAAFNGNGERVLQLLKAGAVVDQKDDHGLTPLMAAISGNHPDAAATLISYKADPNIPNADGHSARSLARAAGWTRLGPIDLYTRADFDRALKVGDAAVVGEMLSHPDHQDWLTSEDGRGWQPMARAAEIGNAGIIRILLAHGVKVDPIGNRVPSPLMAAAANGQRETVVLLLSNGADPLNVDGAGHNAADVARLTKHLDVMADLQQVIKERAKKINFALASLGYLDKPDDTWGRRNKEALDKFFSAFRELDTDGSVSQTGAAPVALDRALQGTLRFCNRTSSTIDFAVVWNPDVNNTKYQTVKAWYLLDEGKCKWMQANITNTVLVHVHSGSGDWTGGSTTLCLPKKEGKIDNYSAKIGNVCEGDTKPVSFSVIDPRRTPNPVIFGGDHK